MAQRLSPKHACLRELLWPGDEERAVQGPWPVRTACQHHTWRFQSAPAQDTAAGAEPAHGLRLKCLEGSGRRRQHGCVSVFQQFDTYSADPNRTSLTSIWKIGIDV